MNNQSCIVEGFVAEWEKLALSKLKKKVLGKTLRAGALLGVGAYGLGRGVVAGKASAQKDQEEEARRTRSLISPY